MRSIYRLVPLLLLTAGLAAGASSAPPALGAVFTVNSTADTVDAAPGDGTCADAGGACTLRAAVMETNALPGADAITLPAGTYLLTIPGSFPRREASNSQAGSSGALTVTDSLALNGTGATGTIIDASGIVGVNGTYDRAFNLFCGIFPPLSLQISDVTIRKGVGEGGGGIYNCGHHLTLQRVLLTENGAASLFGGGLHNQGGTVIIANSTISGNWAQEGGGVSNRGSLSITNTTISENTTISYGGAVWNEWGEATLTNVTVASNVSEARFTGGIGGLFTLSNTLISGHVGGNCGGSMVTLGHNISSDGTCGFAGPGDMQGVDPRLGPLADNGGPTQTHALLPGSPAINAGDNNGCPGTDQRGVARPQQGVCDIGAYEYQPPAPPPPPPPPPPALVQPTAAPTPAPTPTASPQPTPSPTRRPVRSRTPSPTAVLEEAKVTGGGGMSSPVIAGTTLGVLALAGGAGAGGYYMYRRRVRGAV